MAPSNYVIQCWLIISETLKNLFQCIFNGNVTIHHACGYICSTVCSKTYPMKRRVWKLYITGPLFLELINSPHKGPVMWKYAHVMTSFDFTRCIKNLSNSDSQEMLKREPSSQNNCMIFRKKQTNLIVFNFHYVLYIHWNLILMPSWDSH